MLAQRWAPLCALALAGCGGSQGATATPVAHAPSSGMSGPLELEAWATTSGSANGPLMPGEALKTGDRIYLSAKTSQPSSVYIVYCDEKNVATTFPANGGAIHFQAGERRTLPADGKDFRMAGDPGKQTLYLIAARGPLEESDRALRNTLTSAATMCGAQLEQALVGSVRGLPTASPASSAPAPQLPPPLSPHAPAPRAGLAPPHSSTGMRGVVIEDTPDASLRATSGDDGVVVLRFLFSHEP